MYLIYFTYSHEEIAVVADSCYIQVNTTGVHDTSMCGREEPGIKPLTPRFVDDIVAGVYWGVSDYRQK